MTYPLLAKRAARLLGAAVLGAALLTACGGGTSQVDKFAPARVLAFGDELSHLTDDGHKYSVNSMDTTDTTKLNCTLAPLWVQYLDSTAYGKVFSQCPGTATSPDTTAVRQSMVEARVDDVASAIDTYMAGSGFQSTDLVTMLVGMHDVLDQYALYDGSNEAALTAVLVLKGEKLASYVNTIVGTGARVLVSTAPDLGLSPRALADKASKGDTYPAVLTRLTDAFNKAMRLGLINDGSKIGLLMADDLTRAMVRVPSAYGLTNVTEVACVKALPNCTNAAADLVTAASGKSAQYLWADDLRPGATFHVNLGMQAVSRLNTLPF